MSYEIVKHIKIENNKVFVKCGSNDVYPRTFASYQEYPSLSKILNEKGKKALDLEILKAYEEKEGGFYPGTQNKYTRAIEILHHMPEYEKFNYWRKGGNKDVWDNYTKYKATHEQEFDNLLKKALVLKLPKQSYIIIKKVGDKNTYFSHRRHSSHCKWSYEIKKATRFNYQKDAELTKKWFTNKKIKVMKLEHI